MSTSARFVRNLGTLGGVVLLGLLAGPPAPAMDRTDPVFGRELLGYTELADGTVLYRYGGGPVPALLAEDEVTEMRTPSSYTRRLGTDFSGQDVYVLTAYTEETYVLAGNTWRYVEFATTTKAAFDAVRTDRPLATLFLPAAHADTFVPFPSAGDGNVFDSESGDPEFESVLFDSCLDGATSSTFGAGSAGDSLSTTFVVWSQWRSLAGGECNVYVGMLPFDTSSISSSATVSAAVISAYAISKSNGVNDGNDTLVVVQTDQPSTANLTTAIVTDGGIFGGIGSTPVDIGTITTSAYNTFTLDSTGLTWIKKSGQASACGGGTGYSCLGLAERHALIGSMTNQLAGNQVNFSSTEETGTAQDPFITITYSLPGGGGDPPARTTRISEGFILKLVQGRIIIY